MIEKYEKNNFSLKEYFFKRFIRLYIVLIPVLILSFFLGNIYLSNKSEYLSFKTFIGNLLYLQTIYVEVFADNTPLWSLAYEAWYYILFPVLFFLIKGKNKIFNLLILICIIIILWPNNQILLYFFIWLIGVFIFKYKKQVLPFRISFLLFIFIFLTYRIITIPSFSFYIPQSFIGDFILAISVGLLINSLKFYNKICCFSFNKKMADFSYTLYLIHVPILYFLLTFIPKSKKFDFLHILIFLFIICFIYIFAYFFAYLTEFKTKTMFNYIWKRVNNV